MIKRFPKLKRDSLGGQAQSLEGSILRQVILQGMGYGLELGHAYFLLEILTGNLCQNDLKLNSWLLAKGEGQWKLT